MQSFVYRRAVTLTKPLLFATTFMCFFLVVIALFKDIPDVDEDRVFGIQSFSVRLGQERVFWICIYSHRLIMLSPMPVLFTTVLEQQLWRGLSYSVGKERKSS